jgi:hypothetical protein
MRDVSVEIMAPSNTAAMAAMARRSTDGAGGALVGTDAMLVWFIK